MNFRVITYHLGSYEGLIPYLHLFSQITYRKSQRLKGKTAIYLWD